MKAIKKIIEIMLTIVCCISFCAALAEYPEHQFIWSMGWMGLMAVCIRILDKMGVIGEGEI